MIVASRLDRVAEQGRDPRGLSQLDLPRPRLVGHRHGRAQLFQEAGLGAHARPKARCWPPWPRARPISARTAIRSARASATPTCSSACRRTRSSERRAARCRRRQRAPRIVPYEKPRRESGFHFVDHSDARGAHAGRHAVADGGILHRALDHQRQAAARHRSAPCRKASRATRCQAQPRRVHGPGDQLGETVMRVDTEQSTRAQRRGRVASRCGRSRCRTRGCRSTTCSGRPPSCSRSRAGDSGQHADPRRSRGRPHPAADDAGRRRAAQAQAQRRDLCQASSRARRKNDARAELRVRPKVQGAAVVLENKTGRILAMVGGFSYPLSQLNRTDPGAAAARLVDQAAGLSRRAAQGAAAQHAGAGLCR